MPHRCVFLDRDGVINRAILKEGKPYAPRDLAEFEILPGVAEACGRLKSAGFLLVIATNQPDVGRGTLGQAVVEEIHRQVCRQLPVDRVEVCYDSGEGNPPSEFRKPRPGMLLRAARALDIDLGASYMVGDRWVDVECGRAAGCKTILVDYGYSEALKAQPDYTVRGLGEAADIIIGLRNKSGVH